MSPGEESPDSPSGKEPRFDLRLVGFDNITTNTISQLQQALGISPSRARALVDRIPSVVGRRVDRATAFRVVTALREIGAHIAVNERPSGRAIDPAELSSPETFSSVGDAGPTSPLLGRDLTGDLQLGWPDERDPSGAFQTPAQTADDWGGEGGEDEGDDLFGAFERPRRSTPQPRRSVTSLPQDLLRTVRLGEAAAALAAATSGEYPAIQPGREGSGRFTAVESVDLEVVDDEPPPAMPRFLGKLPDFEGTDWRPFWEAPLESSLSPDDEPGAAEGHPGDDEADEGSARRVTGSRKPPGGRSLLVGIAVGAAVIGLLVVLALLPSRVDEGSLERLEAEASRRLPGFELVDAASGEVAGVGQNTLEESLRTGSCYGWIAIAEEGAAGCDLDLELVGAEGALDRDAGADSRPVVFHCAAEEEELRLVLKNVGSEPCPYLLGRYQRPGSHSFPVDPYLELYMARLAATEDLPSRRPEGRVFHGQLETGTAEQTLVAIPANSCRQILAVSPQGTNLDLRLRVDGAVVSEHTLPDNHPIVDHCSDDSEVLAELELRMVAGSGPFAWQVFSSQ